jgi:hypothetical protein
MLFKRPTAYAHHSVRHGVREFVNGMAHTNGKLAGIAAVSQNKEEYERHFNKVFGQQFEMDLDNGDKT